MTGRMVDDRMTATRRKGLSAIVAVAVIALTAGWLALANPAFAGKSLSGTMVVNGGAQFTASSTVTVVAQVRGARTMRYKKPDGSYSRWETYVPTTTLDLGADGVKVVEGQFRGSNGGPAVLQAGIVLDSTGPTTTSDYDGVPRRQVTVILTAVDALSDVAATVYRVDGGLWQEGAIVTLRVTRKRIGLSAGTHALEFYSIDALGNVGPMGSSAIVLQ